MSNKLCRSCSDGRGSVRIQRCLRELRHGAANVGRTWPTSGRLCLARCWPMLVICWSTLANANARGSGQAPPTNYQHRPICGSTLAEAGHLLANVGQLLAKRWSVWATVCQIRAQLSPALANTWSTSTNLGRRWPILAKFGQDLQQDGPDQADIDAFLPNLHPRSRNMFNNCRDGRGCNLRGLLAINS